MKALFVVEGSGKVSAFKSALERLQAPFGLTRIAIEVTKGHIAGNPLSFNPLGIDSFWKETNYCLSPSRRREVANITKAASEADVIYLATDDDHEGDVIARDVARFVLPGRRLLRCRLRAIDHQGLRHALQSAQPMSDSIAVRGDSRRIVDRVVGGVLSDLTVAGIKRPVGRVFSSLLGLLAKRAMPLGTVTVAISAQDGGAAFVARIPFDRHTDLDLLRKPSPPATVGDSGVMALKTPWNYADILAHAADRFDLPLIEVAPALQQAYERGILSYPRATARAVTADGLAVCKAIAERNGCTFDPTRIAAFSESRSGAHEAPRPLAARSLTQSISGDRADQIAALVTRNLIESGQNYLVENPAVMCLPEQLQPFASAFSRSTLQGWLGWKERGSAAPGTVHRDRPEIALLRAMEANGLGQPSTWITHVGKVLKRGVVDENLALTKHGRDLLETARCAGVDAGFSGLVECALDSASASSADASDLARHAVAVASRQALDLIDEGLNRADIDASPDFG